MTKGNLCQISFLNLYFFYFYFLVFWVQRLIQIKIYKFINTNDEEVMKYVSSSLYNRGNYYGQCENYKDAISDYKLVVNKFIDNELEFIQINVGKSLHNLIELLIIVDEDISEYIELYKNKYSENIAYIAIIDMLQIISNAKVKEQEIEINEWKEIYKDISHEKWSFDELKLWLVEIKDSNMKSRIETYVQDFEKFFDSNKK